MKKIITFLGLYLWAFNTMAMGLCDKAEVTYFSCPVKGGKTLSVCGKKAGETLTFLQYRFGTAQKKELVYPADNAKPSDAFDFSHYWRLDPATNEDFLSFIIIDSSFNSTSYTVTSAFYAATISESGKAESKKGVQVEVQKSGQDTSQTTFVKCNTPITNQLDQLQGLVE
ncbi:hypothetical protein K1X76_09110 [bacterium]|nr:hypothetical protein [bacterium]